MTPQASVFLAMLHGCAEGRGPLSADGTPHGNWVFWSGCVRRAEGAFIDGSPHGKWRVWDTRGQLRSESHWDRSRPCGRWMTWDAAGRLERLESKSEPETHEELLVVLAQRSQEKILPV